MRGKTGKHAPDGLAIDLRDGVNFRNGLKVICPVQSPRKK
jgi:hypothetical protein